MSRERYRYFAEIDWTTESHEVCVLDPEQPVVDRKAVEHTASGIAQFVEYLEKLSSGDAEKVAIGIEIPRGQMVNLCPGVDEPWLWELIELAPAPAKAAKLTRIRVEKILRSHRIRRQLSCVRAAISASKCCLSPVTGKPSVR